MKKSPVLLSLFLLGALTACDDDPMGTPMVEPTTFDVRIENISTVFGNASSGVFNTPVGADAPGPAGPGAAYQAEFSAAPGHKLFFATMFVQSNDLFYAPDGSGIPLYDDSGNPVSGDVTSQVMLWDSGTEIDQEPGAGADQAPRQTGPDTGADDAVGTVRMAMNTYDNLPDPMAAIRVTLTPMDNSRFMLRIENVGNGMQIMTSDGGMAPMVLAPGVFAVSGGMDVLFTAGSADRGEGLEALAEDGNPAGLAGVLADDSGVTGPIAPGVYAVGNVAGVLFMNGLADRGEGLEGLAEDGSPTALAAAAAANANVTSSGAFNTPVGAGGPAPAFPGEAYAFQVTAVPGETLSFATMFVQSNDLFFAPGEAGIALFSASDVPLSGDITSEFMYWDAGTEVNQEPGIGSFQAPRQPGPNTGTTENGLVRLLDDGFEYPAVGSVIRVTITPVS